MNTRHEGMRGMRGMSRASMRQIQHEVVLNECLHPQKYYVQFEIKDPEDKLVLRAGMSHDQFVRMLLYNGDTPITLFEYRGLDGKITKEVVEPPDSVTDNMLKNLGKSVESIDNRMKDIEKDIYELLNSGKSVGKKKLEALLLDIRTIRQHYASNIPYTVQVAAEEVDAIQDNAKSQLAIFAQNILGADLDKEAFAPLLEGDSVMALPDKTAKPIDEPYEMKEREDKPIEEMTAREIADAIHRRLKSIEAVEVNYFEKHKLGISGKYREAEHRRNLYSCSAYEKSNRIYICYISYHSSHKVETERAREYLKFLRGIKNLSEFKTDYWFDRKE